MDGFKGYNQIRMNPKEEKETAFVTERGVFCYKVMTFGLRNAGATYQRMVTKVFKSQLGRSMEVNMDDMLVKSRKAGSHLKDLHEAFKAMRRCNMKVNQKKCAFGVG